jgi:hypothetical protein
VDVGNHSDLHCCLPLLNSAPTCCACQCL